MNANRHNSDFISGEEIEESSAGSWCDKTRFCLGYHVARALRDVEDEETRSLVWFLHGAAGRVGGFDQLSRLIPQYVPHLLGTRSMRNASKPEREKWADSLALAVGRELGSALPVGLGDLLDQEEEPEEIPNYRENCPNSYQEALQECAAQVGAAGDYLREYCLQSRSTPLSIRGTDCSIPDLVAEFRREWNQRSLEPVAETTITRKVYGALDYAIHAGPGITIIQGDPRTGKTVSAKAWCDANLDRARFLSMESAQTDSSFFADVNAALGNQRPKNTVNNRLRLNIREVLDTRDLVLVIDEAHWMFANARTAIPNKVNWVMTGVVNRGCSIVLVVTPQFLADLGRIERDTAWAAAQWKGRIVNLQKLPLTIPDEEIHSVAKKIFPEGDREAISYLAGIAAASPSYLQAIGAVVSRARFLASRSGADVTTEHIKTATEEQLNLVEDMAESVSAGLPKPRRARERVSQVRSATGPAETSSSTTHANRLQSQCTGRATPVQRSDRVLAIST